LADDAAWVREALRRFEAPLLRFAASIAGPAHAPDVVQDTFLELCREDRRKVESHLAAWLFTVCKNRALDRVRSERRLQPIEEADVEPSPDSGPVNKLERKENATRVGAALEALPERQREALLLKIDGGLSYKEIAEVMNTSVSNVGFILHAAVSKIREQLAAEEAPAARQLGRTS
jgi:RNA polymerase sigma-70 factor (ECF subfamily)